MDEQMNKPMEPSQPTQTPTPEPSNNNGGGKGYGKRPMWQWVAIYVVVGAIVYGAVWYFYMR